VPGNLVQFVSKFEASKVDGCLAYWTTAGGLNDLVTHNNQATGGWWLYKWYGELTGNTVAVTPPSASGSLQGVAALDSAKKQARVVFGGNNPATGAYDTNVVVKGIPSYLGQHGPRHRLGRRLQRPQRFDRALRGQGERLHRVERQITVPLTGLKGQSAYQIVLTPNTDLSAATSSRYEAEYAGIGGTAKITYGRTPATRARTSSRGTAPARRPAPSSWSPCRPTATTTSACATPPVPTPARHRPVHPAAPQRGRPDDRGAAGHRRLEHLEDATTKVYLPAGISRWSTTRTPPTTATRSTSTTSTSRPPPAR